MLLFERSHDRAAVWRRELGGIVHAQPEHDLERVTRRPFGDEYRGSPVRMSQAAGVMISLKFERVP